MTLSPLFSRTRQGYPPSALAGDAPTTPPATAASDAMSVATASAARLGMVGEWWMVMGITPLVLAIVDGGRSSLHGFVADHRTDWTHVVAVVALPGAGETGAGLGEIGRVGVDQGVGACGVGAAFGVSQVLRAGVGERRQARASQQSIRVGAPNTG